MRSGPRSLLLASILAAAAVGCDHRPEDFSRIQASTDQFMSGWTRKVSGLEARHAELVGRAQKLPADAPGLAEILSRLTAMKGEIQVVGTKLATVGQTATAKVQEKRTRLAGEALEHGEQDLTVDVAGISSRLDEISAQLDTLDQDAAAKAAAAAADAAANKPPPHFDDPEFARGTHRADVPGIGWKGATIDATAATKQALDRVVAFAGRCDELRFGITGHTAKDGDAKVNQQLSESRAHAVRKYLVANGVPAAKIVAVEGVGGTQPLLPEPGPGEEAAIAADELARVRDVNRRISIQVLTPCP
jgi:outer membrane protein OmpA-like peptidoglycan-associated protein